MRLWLMRHGRAGSAPSDDERRLTKNGAEIVLRVAARLKALGLDSPVILSSPLPRAVETARLTAGVVGAISVSVSDDLKPGAGPERQIELLRGVPAGSDCMFVGHQPDMGALASLFCGCAPLNLVPAEAVCIKVREEDGSFRGEIEYAVSPQDPSRPAL